MANEQNLIPFTSNQSREEAERNGQKGGKKSGEVRRQKKKMKDMMNLLLSIEVHNDNDKEILNALGIEENDMNLQTVMLLKQLKKATEGNLDSAKFVREVSEDFKPNTEIVISTDSVISEIDDYISKRVDNDDE